MGTDFKSVAVQAVILAAGESKRMGSPKALLEFDGEKAVEKVLKVCDKAGILKPLVVLGAQAENVQKKAELCSARIVMNRDWNRGQTSSVKAGVRELEPEANWFLVWPVDLPLVPLEALRALLAATPPNPSKTILVPTFQGRRGHPVRFAASLAPEILALSDDEPLHAVVRKDPARVQDVPVASEAVLRDFDKPADL